MSDRPRLSVIVPVKDEEDNIPLLAEEIRAALEGVCDWECLWIDDGSSDGSRAAALTLAAADPRHRVLAMAHNSGQSAAMLAGFRAAHGDLLATLDGDRQNDPADLPRLMATLESSGLDALNGYRQRRRDTGFRRFSSRVANGARNAVTGYTVRDVGCSLRVFRRECARNLPPFKGMHRFLPVLFTLDGFRIGEAPVNHRERAAGTTKYGLHNRLWVGLADLVGIFWLKRRFASYRIQELPIGKEL
ncbi:MAG: glycosyltransferase family 2 protein [Candidatus Delongbacteria bacterium]|nr:glycosyltransferase family 2 protein [Candidatus Delongbacteria bacterium]